MIDTALAPHVERAIVGVEPSDAALVAAVRRGDDRAFEQLFGRYQRRIAAYVYGMVSDHGRAEDITQEIFISALRRMRETEREIAFKPWIYEIAKNACIDQFRRSRRTEEVSYDADEGLGAADYGRLAQSGPSPDAAVDQKQALHDLCGAFGGLSETHHQILVLRELEGLSYREIGDRLGMSRPSVESTLFRARRRLSEEYDELASGQRCLRVQALIANAAEGLLGARDNRRLARHLSHCQPCRRQARAAGVDAGVMARRPGRQALGAKIAALFPFPALLQRRRSGGESVLGTGGSSHGHAVVSHWSAIGTVSEPVVAGWSKAAAAAATLVLAGVGAGVGAHVAPQPARAGADDKRSAPARSSSGGERPSRGAVRTVEPRSPLSGGVSRPGRRDRGAGGLPGAKPERTPKRSTSPGPGSGAGAPTGPSGPAAERAPAVEAPVPATSVPATPVPAPAPAPASAPVLPASGTPAAPGAPAAPGGAPPAPQGGPSVPAPGSTSMPAGTADPKATAEKGAGEAVGQVQGTVAALQQVAPGS